jgi:hypothetical protein
MIAAVMAALSTAPPLSIALLGDWAGPFQDRFE